MKWSRLHFFLIPPPSPSLQPNMEHFQRLHSNTMLHHSSLVTCPAQHSALPPTPPFSSPQGCETGNGNNINSMGSTYNSRLTVFLDGELFKMPAVLFPPVLDVSPRICNTSSPWINFKALAAVNSSVSLLLPWWAANKRGHL